MLAVSPFFDSPILGKILFDSPAPGKNCPVVRSLHVGASPQFRNARLTRGTLGIRCCIAMRPKHGGASRHAKSASRARAFRTANAGPRAGH
jgi:hypothetical protein